MKKRMMLKGHVRFDSQQRLVFSSKLYDGTAFEMLVRPQEVELNEPLTEQQSRVDGWLFVTQEAEQGDRRYLTLPQPVLQYGRQILVKDLQLMVPGTTIGAFRPRTVAGTKPTPETAVPETETVG